MTKVCLGNIADIIDGQAKGFDPASCGQDSMFVVRKGSKVYAYRDICPHYASTSLPWKRHHYLDASANNIVCAAHGALFAVHDGMCLRGPCVGQSLKTIEIEVGSNNEMWVDLKTIKEFKV
ncbi:MAG: Rieske 2Fe-2S domain-containing protein [Aliiglaciecola sp.]|uniref:Rieske (2Fe-2S) protein n=1 Tax=Aliiglaciecola sp. TaxID=1872441 RepID=UPI003299B2E5